MTQRLALFDLDGTLVDRRAAFEEWAAEFAADHGLDEGALAWLLTADSQTSGTKSHFFRTVRAHFALRPGADDLWQQYRQRMPELVRCRPADAEALRRLRRGGWRIGIVTNGMADNQHGKIRRTGLDKLVDAWCSSGEVDIRKPDPRIFAIAAERCGASLSDGGWMIGDDPHLDIEGGRNAGLHTILLTPRPVGGSVVPDHHAESVEQAVELILRHGNGS